MKPLDPRLLRYARAARTYIGMTTGFGILAAALIVAQALLIAHALAPVIDGTKDLSDVVPLLVALAAVFAARSLVISLQERFAHRAASRTIGELRSEVLEHSVRLGPRWLADGHGPEVVTLATRGLDDLEPYFVRYLPQLLLAVTLTPATLAVIFGLDLTSAILIIITIPLIPIFMILIGKLTQSYADARLASMTRLGAQILDLLAGLPTLRALRRENGPAARVRSLGEAHERATMGTLRVAFLSGMALEFLTTLSVALVAVSIGLRLVGGNLSLTTGLAVLILAPEVYLPLRQVGAHFHASADGVAASNKAFEILETPLPESGSTAAPSIADSTIRLEGLGVRAPGRDVMAPFDLSGVIEPGRITALAGPNGAGKSTTVSAILGLLAPDQGRVVVVPNGGEAIDLADIESAGWWSQIAWVPQRPAMTPGSVLDNVAGTEDGLVSGTEAHPSDRIREAALLTGFADVVDSLPNGWGTQLGQGGVGLSVGQRQRLALTRALAGSQPLVILDEPTAHLDALSEDVVLSAVRSLSEAGRTVIIVAHRASLLSLADTVIDVDSALVDAEQEVTR